MSASVRILLTSVALAVLTCFLLTIILVATPESVRSAPVAFLAGAAPLGLWVSLVYGVPFGVVGGLVAVRLFRKRPRLPRSRWPVRGALVGVLVGAVGSSLFPLLMGDPGAAAFVALIGSIAGAIVGGLTGAVLGRALPDGDA